jgi:hypothetical protein
MGHAPLGESSDTCWTSPGPEGPAGFLPRDRGKMVAHGAGAVLRQRRQDDGGGHPDQPHIWRGNTQGAVRREVLNLLPRFGGRQAVPDGQAAGDAAGRHGSDDRRAELV